MARQKYASDQYRYNLSFPPGMRERIKSAAKENHRTMNAEIVIRLQESLQRHEVGISTCPDGGVIIKGTNMNVKNNITLEQLRNMPEEQIATLPPAELADLVEEATASFRQAKMTKDFLDNALAHKYGDHAALVRREKGKPTGVVRFNDGEFIIVSDLPKKPVWDQEKLVTIVEEIRQDGVDPANYIDTLYKVQERRFTAWPPHIQEAFMAARTLKVGKPTYKIERAKSKGEI